MHILFYTNWFVKLTAQLANALAAEHRITLVFPDVSPEMYSKENRVDEIKAVLDPSIEVITLPHMQNLDPLGIIPVMKARRLIKQLQPDVVHFNESYDFRCLLLMKSCPGTTFVTTVHDPVPHEGEDISLHKFKHWVRDQIRHRSQGLVVHGDKLRKILSDYSDIPIERIFSVPHGEYKYYTRYDKGNGGNGSNGHRKILFFGRWEEYKGIDVLIEAEPYITERFPDAQIVLAGEGRVKISDLQSNIANADKFDIRNYAIPDDEVPRLFEEAEMLVLPYRNATGSGPLHIAGTFKRPSVVSRVGVMPEVVKDGETGILVKPDDPKELADAICRLLDDPEEARRMGEAAHDLTISEDSIENTARIQERVYQDVLESRRLKSRPGFAMKITQKLVTKIKRDPDYKLDQSMRFGDLAAMMMKLGFGFARGLINRPFFGGVKGLYFIGRRVKLRNRKHIFLGRNFIAEDDCEIQGLSKEGIHFGNDVTIGSYAMIRPSGYYGRESGVGLRMGDGSNIGAYSYIGASGGITIGREVMMGPRVSLYAENHNFDDTGVAMRRQGSTLQGIVIEDDCWLAGNCIILDGVTVGKSSIVAAGAVVTKDVPPYSIAGGNPARIIRSRNAEKITETEVVSSEDQLTVLEPC